MCRQKIICNLLYRRQRIPDDPYWPPMLGHLLPNSQIFRIPLSRIHDRYAPREYYVCPTYFYNGTGNYPSYMQGAGYFLPWWVLQCIYEQSIELPYFFIEDVFFGGFAGKTRNHNELFGMLPRYALLKSGIHPGSYASSTIWIYLFDFITNW